jgi:hypothetical protein
VACKKGAKTVLDKEGKVKVKLSLKTPEGEAI